ncbi:MAG TPA: HupE/UreJ family protein [Myxococcota bacterium]|nr:HupE/UreJ family protein [Myxococcota bacterium]
MRRGTRPRRARALRCACVALLSFAAASARAHPLAPSLLELREGDGSEVALVWRTPRVAKRGEALEPVLPAACRETASAGLEVDDAAITRRATLQCDGGLLGATLSARGLDDAAQVLVRVQLRDGRSVEGVLSRGSPRFEVSARTPRLVRAISFVRLGAEHLATGVDHLLFLAGLFALLRGRRALFVAVSAFTLGHGTSLAAVSALAATHPGVTLDAPRALSTCVEIGIAASLVLVGREALERSRGEPAGALTRRPAALPFGFGLLHGLGFAGALGAAGLPADALPLALAGFHLGLEATQLVFLAMLAGATALLSSTAGAVRLRLASLGAHAIGATGAYLMLDRALGLF